MTGSTSRGGLVGRTREADRIAQAKLGRLRDTLDRMSDTGGAPPFGGDSLTREQFRLLLANDPHTQQRVIAALPYATEEQKARLRRDLERVREMVPDTAAAQAPLVGPVPPLPFPEDELRRP